MKMCTEPNCICPTVDGVRCVLHPLKKDWLVLRVEPDGLRQFENLRCVNGRDDLQ